MVDNSCEGFEEFLVAFFDFCGNCYLTGCDLVSFYIAEEKGGMNVIVNFDGLPYRISVLRWIVLKELVSGSGLRNIKNSIRNTDSTI